jgi:hypothetical protein
MFFSALKGFSWCCLSEDAMISLLQGDLFMVEGKNRSKMREINVIEWY